MDVQKNQIFDEILKKYDVAIDDVEQAALAKVGMDDEEGLKRVARVAVTNRKLRKHGLTPLLLAPSQPNGGLSPSFSTTAAAHATSPLGFSMVPLSFSPVANVEGGISNNNNNIQHNNNNNNNESETKQTKPIKKRTRREGGGGGAVPKKRKEKKIPKKITSTATAKITTPITLTMNPEDAAKLVADAALLTAEDKTQAATLGIQAEEYAVIKGTYGMFMGLQLDKKAYQATARLCRSKIALRLRDDEKASKAYIARKISLHARLRVKFKVSPFASSLEKIFIPNKLAKRARKCNAEEEETTTAAATAAATITT